MKASEKQKIIFVTGKGGVGKSAVAAAVALKSAQSGKRTLLVELGYQSFYQDYFSLPHVGYEAVPLKPHLDVALWSGPQCLKEYARHLLKVERLYKLFFENSVTKSLINVAPALSELAIMGKVTSHPRKVGPPLPYDCLVIDAFATGHFLALIQAPRGMSEAIRIGPMGEQSRSIERVLKDPDQCSYYVVSIPEELPVIEGMELWEGIHQILGISPLHVFNRFLNPSEEALQVKDAAPKDFQSYLKRISTNEKDFSAKLETQGAVIKVPQMFSVEPWEVIEGIAEALP